MPVGRHQSTAATIVGRPPTEESDTLARELSVPPGEQPESHGHDRDTLPLGNCGHRVLSPAGNDQADASTNGFVRIYNEQGYCRFQFPHCRDVRQERLAPMIVTLSVWITGESARRTSCRPPPATTRLETSFAAASAEIIRGKESLQRWPDCLSFPIAGGETEWRYTGGVAMADGRRRRRSSLNMAKRKWYAFSRSCRFASALGYSMSQ